MMRFLAAGAVAFIANASAASEPNPMQPVPPQFQGDWNSKMEDCDSGSNDSALSIDARWIRFYESGGPILAVIYDGKSTLSLIARLSSAEEEGATWDAPMKFEISPNGAVLKDVTSQTITATRYKCPHHFGYSPKPKRH